MSELKPCPFCGGAELYIEQSTPDREGTPKFGRCGECGATGPIEYTTPDDTTRPEAAWNTRHVPEREALEKALRDCVAQLEAIDDGDSPNICACINQATAALALLEGGGE